MSLIQEYYHTRAGKAAEESERADRNMVVRNGQANTSVKKVVPKLGTTYHLEIRADDEQYSAFTAVVGCRACWGNKYATAR